MDTLLQILLNMVRSTPSDADLGKKVRSLVKDMAPDLIKENKQILKG